MEITQEFQSIYTGKKSCTIYGHETVKIEMQFSL